MAPIVLIPAYEPSQILLNIARSLLRRKIIQALIIVNDGSSSRSKAIFRELKKQKRVHVLSHKKNRGKGAALKTGFSYAARKFPHSVGVITADADGQHEPKDIIRVAKILQKNAQDLILGSRSFDASTPLRSKFGNVLTSRVFEIFSGQKLLDTQTGLRGIPINLIPVCLTLPQNGFDYELQMLLTIIILNIKIREVNIQTIYIDNNKSSHFKPMLDSLRIYSVFLRAALFTRLV